MNLSPEEIRERPRFEAWFIKRYTEAAEVLLAEDLNGYAFEMTAYAWNIWLASAAVDRRAVGCLAKCSGLAKQESSDGVAPAVASRNKQGAVYTEPEVLDLLRSVIKKAGSQKAFADQAGISCQYVNDVVLGRRGVGASIADALGLVHEDRWRRADLPGTGSENTELSPPAAETATSSSSKENPYSEIIRRAQGQDAKSIEDSIGFLNSKIEEMRPSKEPLSSSKEVREVLERLKEDVEEDMDSHLGNLSVGYVLGLKRALTIINRYLEETK